MDFCKYKDMLGKPGEGIHSFRLFGVAIVDVAFTVIGAAILSYYTSYRFTFTLPFLFMLGIILHRLFCVKTTVNNYLFS